MNPYYEADRVTLYLGDCIKVMHTLLDASVDAIVTDPPYELGFMGKGWDRSGIANSVEMWSEALRVLKPGGHLAAFGGTRTYHRMACAVEDAGFEIRDCLAWMYGSGFPKSMDVSKAIDKAAGHWRGRAGSVLTGNGAMAGPNYARTPKGDPITAAAAAAAGWGTALKPAYEPIVLARKPLVGTVAANVLQYGTGAINVDGCRIEGAPPSVPQPVFNSPTGHTYGFKSGKWRNGQMSEASGRWPANVLLDEEAAAILDQTVGESRDGVAVRRNGVSGGEIGPPGSKAVGTPDLGYGGGGPSRFFYTAKASRSEREAGLENIEAQRRHDAESRDEDAPGSDNPRLRVNARRNDHPTVKPLDLMVWLCRLVTPSGGVILDPFNGSGTTGMGALDEGFRYIGIEREERYIEISRHRIAHRHLTEVTTVESTEEQQQGMLL